MARRIIKKFEMACLSCGGIYKTRDDLEPCPDCGGTGEPTAASYGKSSDKISADSETNGWDDDSEEYDVSSLSFEDY